MVDIGKYKKLVKIKQKRGDYSLSGCTGYCFINDDKIIKVYNRSYMFDEIDDMSSYSSDRISFPIEYIKKCRKYYGEILPYFNAISIMDGIRNNCNIDIMMKHYYDIVKEIKKYPGIMMNDLSYPNILYNEKNGFYLIDITNWKKKNLNYDLSIINIGELNESILYCFSHLINGDGFDYSWFLDFIDKNNIYLNCYGNYYDFVKVMDLYREFLLKRYGFIVNNIEDMKKNVKILKKS